MLNASQEGCSVEMLFQVVIVFASTVMDLLAEYNQQLVSPDSIKLYV